MLKTQIAVLVAGVAVASGVLGAVLAQDGMQMPTPGPQHAIFKHFEGTWDATVKMAAMEGMPASESKGSSVDKVICGGMWHCSDFSSTMMGAPFTGHSLLGWDTFKNKYRGVWVDSFGMELGITEGTWDAKTNTLTQEMDGHGMDGQMMHYVMTDTVKDKDHRTFTMSEKGKDGKLVQTMTIEYTRKK